MRHPQSILLFLLLLTCALPAAAQSSVKAGDKFAVLDFWSEDESIDHAYLETFSDLLRSAAAEASGDRFAVMRRETMLQLLPAQDLRCGMGDCMATIGQKLQAQLVTGGTIRRVGSRVSLTVEAYDTTTSAMLGSKVMVTNDFDEALDRFGSEATALFRDWLPGVTTQPASPASARGSVRVRDDSAQHRLPAQRPTLSDLPRRPTDPAAFVDVLVHDVAGRELHGARVHVNGTLEGSAPRSIRLEPGTHTISVERSLYFSAETSLSVSAGDSQRLEFTLEPNFGTLSIDSHPPGATVSLDGIPLGTTPLIRQQIATGTHQLHLDLEDHVPEMLTVDVAVGAELEIRRELAADFGPLLIRSQPSGAQVILDGREMGTTPLRLDKVRAGRRTVEIRGDSAAYEPFVTRVMVERDIGAPDIEAALERKESELVVTTNPPGASVHLNGEYLGTTTYRGTLLGGDYELKVVHEGYVPLTRNLEHRPPRTSLLSLDLRRGGTGVGGRYTAADLGLSYQSEPAPPALEPVPNISQTEFRLPALLFNLVVGAAIGGLTGYGMDIGLAEEFSYDDDYGTPMGVFTGLGVLAGAGIYVAINSNQIWRRTGIQPDPAVVERNAARQRQHQREVERVREHNRSIDERIEEENAHLTGGRWP